MQAQMLYTQTPELPISPLADSRAHFAATQPHITSPQVNIGMTGEKGRKDSLCLQELTLRMPDCKQGQKPSLGGYSVPLAKRVLGATKR